ncbi:ABC transporter permease [Cupriavidus necator]
MSTFIFAFKLVPRLHQSVWAMRVTPFVALALTVLFSALLFSAQGASPAKGVYTLVLTPLSSIGGLAEVVLKACPLCITALGLAIAFRSNVNNIGAEGQAILGGIGATAVALNMSASIPGWLALPAVLIGGVAGGALWAAVPAVLRTRFAVNETLSSLLLAYVAAQLLSWVTSGPWRDPHGLNFPETELFADNVTLPSLASLGWSVWEGTRLNLGVVIAAAGVATAALFLERSRIGYELIVAGQSPRAASYAGVSKRLAVWVALLCSGGAAGLAGAVEVSGSLGQLQAGWVPGYGFTAIVAAYLGRLKPASIAVSSVLLALVEIGSLNLQMELGLPSALSFLIQGFLLLSILGMDLLVRYDLQRRTPTSTNLQTKEHDRGCT